MGVFLPQGYGSTVVNVDIDGTALTQLACSKAPELLFQHFVDRCDALVGVVLDLGSRTNRLPVRQVNTRFSDPGDVAAARAGLILNWVDCSTKFLDLTPQTTTGKPTLAVYLRLMIGPVGSFAGPSTPCPASLLV